MSAEYWVMRVVLHHGRQTQLNLFAGVDATGKLLVCKPSDGFVLLPDYAIAEPVEVYDVELEAHIARDLMASEHPAEDFRVILNSDVPLA
jgi:hypothetical protein